MQDIVAIDYEAMQVISTEFFDVSEHIQQVVSRVNQQYDVLEGGEWVADGANFFYQEMDQEVFPALLRLVKALARAGEVSNKIILTFEEAEETASQDLMNKMMSNMVLGAVVGMVGFVLHNTAVPMAAISWAYQLINNVRGNTATLPDSLTGYNGEEHPRPDWFRLSDNSDGGFNGAPNANILYINGILTDHDSHTDAIFKVSTERAGAPVTGIYNDTSNMVSDVYQSFNDMTDAWVNIRLDAGNPAVDSAVQWIQSHPNGEIVVHSQGSAIIAAALNDAERQGIDINGLQVTTLGGAGNWFPDGPDYHHIVSQNDPIPRLANAGNLIGYDQNDRVSVIPGVNDSVASLGSHKLDWYLENMNDAQHTASQFESGAIREERRRVMEFIYNTTINTTPAGMIFNGLQAL